jgi:hypothetical protein
LSSKNPRTAAPRRPAALAVLVCAIGLATAGSALGDPVQSGPELTASEAEQVLDAAEAALNGEQEIEATAALDEVADLLPALSGEQRRRGEGLLARPTDRAADPEDNGYTASPIRAVATTNYCYFWVESGADAVPLRDTDGDGVPDYVETLAATAEFVHSVEHGQLGWRLPPSDGARGCDPGDGRARVDIYVKDLVDGRQSLDGYVARDPGQGERDQQFSYMVVENDLTERTNRPAEVLPALRAMIAHEYNHVVQCGYSSFQDVWMDESTANWMEEQVYPEVNDYIGYVEDFARLPQVPLTEEGARHLKVYGSAVWNHHLSARFGRTVVRRAWEATQTARPSLFSAAAYDRAIRAASRGSSTFEKEFVRFAAATPEWRFSGVFPDGEDYPEVRRSGQLRGSRGYRLDHTTFRLAGVRPGRGRALALVLRGPRGVGLGLALVGRIGSGADARVVSRSRTLPNGGRGAVTLPRPGRFARITAVVANGDITVDGYGRTDWRYRHDNVPVSAHLFRR